MSLKSKVSFSFLSKVVLLLTSNFGLLTIHSQDLHFSQYYRTPIFLNPANTGNIEDDVRVMAIARNQWQTLPVSYNSIGASVDVNFPVKITRDKFGAGLQLLADRSGDSKFTTVQATGSGAYHLVTSGVNFMILSVGGNVNYIQRSYDPNKLTFDNQFNGDYFDPNIPINEQFDRLSLSFVDFGLGLNWQQSIWDAHVVNFGGSMQHLASSQQSFLNSSTNALLQPRYNAYFNGEYNFNNRYSLIPLFFYQYQDKKYEIVTGLGFGLNLDPKSHDRNKVKLGLNLRIDDALIAWAQYEYKRSSFQLSYDANTSPLKIASASYGGIEFTYGCTFQIREKRERMYDFCPYIWF